MENIRRLEQTIPFDKLRALEGIFQLIDFIGELLRSRLEVTADITADILTENLYRL